MQKSKALRLISSLIAAGLSVAGLLFFNAEGNSALVMSCLFFALFAAAYHTHLPQKRSHRAAIFTLACVFAVCNVLGRICVADMYAYQRSVLRDFFTARSLCTVICQLVLFSVILCFFVEKASRVALLRQPGDKKHDEKRFFALSALFILLCTLPLFIHYYPGIMSYDTRLQLYQVTGLEPLSNHHPVFHTLLIAIPYKAMKLFGASNNAAFGAVCACQMILMSLIFAYICTRLYLRGIKMSVAVGCVAFYALVPVCAFFNITPWKDIPFSAVAVLFTLDLEVLLSSEGKPKPLLLVSLFGNALLMTLLRNNAVYMIILTALILFFVLKNNKARVVGGLLGTVAIFTIFNSLILPAVGVRSTESAEYLGIPLQQMARLTAKDIEYSPEDKALLEKLITVEDIKSTYDPYSVDRIKLSDAYHGEAFNENRLEFAKLWLKNAARHPSVFIESHLISTVGYWYPETDCPAVTNIMMENELGIARANDLGNGDTFYDHLVTYRADSLIKPLMSPALWVWAAAALALSVLVKRGARLLCIFLPSLGVWLTLMVAAPVIVGARYIYCILLSLPIYFCSAFLPTDMSKKKLNNTSRQNRGDAHENK